MERPLVYPSKEKEDKNFQDLIQFFNETLGFCPNSVKTMYHRPSIAYAFIELNHTLVFEIKFCGKSPALRVAAKRLISSLLPATS